MGGIILKHSIITRVYQLSCTRELTIGVAVNVKAELELSKNAFKRAVGHLLKEGKIEIVDGDIKIK